MIWKAQKFIQNQLIDIFLGTMEITDLGRTHKLID